jgi:hypothetical protein
MADVDISVLPCRCDLCEKKADGYPITSNEICLIELRAKAHMAEVAVLYVLKLNTIEYQLTCECSVKRSPAVTLVVGQEKVRMVTHKFLLSFYSGYFDRIIYQQEQSAQNEIALPEKNVELMEAFVSWLYSGRLDRFYDSASGFTGSTFYVLGTQLEAPSFINDSMHFLCDLNYSTFLPAAAARFAYAYTSPGSQLRIFTADLIKFEGPFSEDIDRNWDMEEGEREAYRNQWVKLLGEGGDLVMDMARQGFHSTDEQLSPWRNWNRMKYMEDEPKKSAAAWHEEKILIDMERQKELDKQAELEQQKSRKRKRSSRDCVDLTSPEDEDNTSRSLTAETTPQLKMENEIKHENTAQQG